jgi:hypothetical protein
LLAIRSLCWLSGTCYSLPNSCSFTAIGDECLCRGVRMSDGKALKSEDLASIPMARGGLTRLAAARLKSAGVPLEPLLRRSGLTLEAIADPEESTECAKPNYIFGRGGTCSEG